MIVHAFEEVNKQAGYMTRQFGMNVLITFILLVLAWLAFQTFYTDDQLEKSLPAPLIEKQTQLPSEPTEGEVKSILPNEGVEPAPKPLNLNVVPIVQSNSMGPVQIEDVTQTITQPSHRESATESTKSEVELNYGYKGRDKQGVHLELGASEKSSQVKLGVQVDDNKVNVNSIEIEVPLSK